MTVDSIFSPNAIISMSFCQPHEPRWLTCAWDDDDVVVYDKDTDDECRFDPAEERFWFLQAEARLPRPQFTKVTDAGFGVRVEGW